MSITTTFFLASGVLLLALAGRALAADRPQKPEAKMEIIDDEALPDPPPKAAPPPRPAPPPKGAPPKPLTKAAPAPAPAADPRAEAKADDKPADKPLGAGGDVGAKPAAAMVVEDGPAATEAPPPVPTGEEKQAIIEYVRDQTTDIHRCYEKRLEQRPTLQGKLYVIFYIGPDGRVIGATTSGLQDAELSRCILPLVRKWEFNKPQSGGKLRVPYPFVFRPQAAR